MTTTRVDLAATRGLPEIARLAGHTWRRHLPVMLPIALISATLRIAELLLRILTPVHPPHTAWSIPQLLVAPLIGGGLISAACDSFSGIRPSLGRSLSRARARYRPFLTTVLLGVALAIASLIAFPYFFVRWVFSSQAVMIEDKANWAALDASSSIVRGHWWRVCGYMLLLAVPSSAYSLTWIAIYFGPGGSRQVYVISQIAWYVAAAVASPFVVAVNTLLYYDLRARYLQRQAAPQSEPSSA